MKLILENQLQQAATTNAGIMNGEFLLILAIIGNCATFSSMIMLLDENNITNFEYGATGSHIWVKQKNMTTGATLAERLIIAHDKL